MEDNTPFQVKGSKFLVIKPPFCTKAQNFLSFLGVESSLICIFYIPEKVTKIVSTHIYKLYLVYILYLKCENKQILSFGGSSL